MGFPQVRLKQTTQNHSRPFLSHLRLVTRKLKYQDTHPTSIPMPMLYKYRTSFSLRSSPSRHIRTALADQRSQQDSLRHCAIGAETVINCFMLQFLSLWSEETTPRLQHKSSQNSRNAHTWSTTPNVIGTLPI